MSDLLSVVRGSRPWHVETCDVLEGLRRLPDGCVQCVVTSPPYYGLRDYGVEGQIGLEPTPQDFLARLVEVFAAVRRVLRDDGTVWLNMGDGYNAYNGGRGVSPGLNNRADQARPVIPKGAGLSTAHLKPKDLMGMPWRLAFALQEAGWWLRSEIIWAKRSPMPESVTDRPTRAHEQIFLLTKRDRYFYDEVASAEPSVSDHPSGNGYKREARQSYRDANGARGSNEPWASAETRNMRTVWTLSTEPNPEAHFATFPSELVRRCLLAGVSEKGCCPKCGAPWARTTEKERVPTRPGDNTKVRVPSGWNTAKGGNNTVDGYYDNGQKPAADKLGAEVVGNRDPYRHVTRTVTTGWSAGCDCGGEPIGCLVLDPFNGSGTTGIVARKLGCRYVGLELNPDYAQMARRRIRADSPLFNT